MIKHTVFAIGLGLTIFFLYLFQYTGAFKSVTLGVDQRPEYKIIYKEHTGPYHKIVQSIQDVETWAKTQGLACRLSFGEYLDDPRLVEEGRLKSRGGCLIDSLKPDEEKIFSEIKNRLPVDIKFDLFKPTKAVVALFAGAPGIGPLKVYPKAEDYIVENKLKRKGSVIEIYEIFDSNSMQTTYIWPIENEN